MADTTTSTTTKTPWFVKLSRTLVFVASGLSSIATVTGIINASWAVAITSAFLAIKEALVVLADVADDGKKNGSVS